jgi:hypothetical protein
MKTSALEQVIRRADERARSAAQRCEMCLEPIASEHRHLLDTDAADTGAAALLCACQACSILFNRAAASRGHYRLVPQRRLPLRGVDPAPLGVPVGLAFFVVRADGVVQAHYPSPAGATRWQVELDAWRRAVAECPPLDELEPDVEALLVDTTGNRRIAWLVPIEDCYRLVAVVRREWKGLSGGDRVRPQIEHFFNDLKPS